MDLGAIGHQCDVHPQEPDRRISVWLTIPSAVDSRFATGAAARERHMRALRDRWVNAASGLRNVEICVPDDAARYCAITSFRLRVMRTDKDVQGLQHVLFEGYRIHTIWRKAVWAGPAIRVTPDLYSTEIKVDASGRGIA